MDLLISIIVPVYNAEEYLDRCLNSIIHQTYKNLEIILINDGSTDKSLDICNRYKMMDSRVKVINQENQGVSCCRNKGINISSGKYIGFVDSDDVIDKDMYRILYDALIKYNCDIACCKYLKFNKDYKFNYSNQTKCYNRLDSIKLLLQEKEITNFLWDKLFKRELFNNISFKNGKIFEDLDIMYKLFDKIDRLVVNDSILYGYYQRNNSYVHSYSYDTLVNYIEVIDDRYNYLIDRYDVIMEDINYNIIYSIYIIFRIIVLARNKSWLDDEYVNEEYQRLLKIYNKKYNIKGIKNILMIVLIKNKYYFYYIASLLYKIKGEC